MIENPTRLPKIVQKPSLWQQRRIQPVSYTKVEAETVNEYKRVSCDTRKTRDHYISINRGVSELLFEGQDYAQLPRYSGKSALSLFAELTPGSIIFEVGCGTGQLSADIISGRVNSQINFPAVNPDLAAYGFDAISWPEQQINLSHVAIGNIDELLEVVSRDSRLGAGFRVDIAVSSALLYHLPDPWFAILQISRLLSPEGKMLLSTMPRVVTAPEGSAISPEDSTGHLRQPDHGQFYNYRNRATVFDTQGTIIPLAEVIKILNKINCGLFNLEWHVASAKHPRTINHGAQISGARINGGDLNLEHMVYCLSNRGIGYILAENFEQLSRLQQEGFLSVQECLEKAV